jgi:AAA+ ATPase superfamily predicted ATPase
MDPVSNPYNPGAGSRPSYLAGRDGIISKANILFKRVKAGSAQRSIMLYGLRGVGKTVLLNHFNTMAAGDGYIVEQMEMSENDKFDVKMTNHIRKILLHISLLENAKDKLKKAFRVLKSLSMTLPNGPEISIDVDAIEGEADSGNFETDLTDMFVHTGNAAKEEGKSVCILIDETQYLKESDMAALIAACHKVSQLELPIVAICAGLPSIAAMAGDAKSYAERLFEFIPVSNLVSPEVELAISQPARKLNVEFTEDAIRETITITKGYPYFIQELGKHTWNHAARSPITVDDVISAKTETLNELDNSFFKVRFDRASNSEKKLMGAMSELGDGPYSMSDVAAKMNVRPSSASPTRATLIRKGFIYAPSHGQINFTVPLFADFLRRSRISGSIGED